MTRFVLRRLGIATATLFVASVLLFLALFVVASPVDAAAGRARSADVRAQLERRYGLDRPLVVQYGRWVGGALRGDLGRSVAHPEQTVNEVIGPRIGPTMALATVAIVLDVGIGAAAGLLSAWRRGRFTDRAVTVAVTVSLGIPFVVVGLILQHLLAVRLGLLPVSGSPPGGFPWLDAHVLLPAITLAIVDAGLLARIFRASLLESAAADFMRQARAKGLSERRVWLRHVVRPALAPVVTYVGVGLATILAGATLVETIFNYDGVGRALIVAIQTSDTPVVIGIASYAVVLFVLVDLLMDVLYAVIDPRVRTVPR